MGIFIYLAISKAVTPKEWEQVYEESLQLVEKLPFAERRKVNIHGIDTICLVHTKEREERCGWRGEEVRIGWETIGDCESLRTAEDYGLSRNFIAETDVEPDAGDAMMGALPSYLSYDWNDERFCHVYEKWGAKTQGEPYHIYLLAVAALIEARLGEKAFTYGDVTRGQFQKAVEIANQYLEAKISLPDRCDMERFLKRVKKLPIPEKEQLAVLEQFYLGVKDAAFGAFLRRTFSETVIEEYWKKKFQNSTVGTIGFDHLFSDYMLWGFDLEKLCEYVAFTDREGNPCYETFVRRVMDAKLHRKEKNCNDVLKIAQDQPQPYGIWTLMAQFAFAGAGNDKVDRFIPIDEIRGALQRAIGSKCDVNRIIDDYLEEEAKQPEIRLNHGDIQEEEFSAAVKQDASEVLSQIMEQKRADLEKDLETYDICDQEDLRYYEAGDTVEPGVAKSVAASRKFLDSALEEEDFEELMKGSVRSRCEWLVEQNRYLLLLEDDWDKVFTDMEQNPDSFRRYYPLMRVRMSNQALVDMCTAFMLNDDFYSYSGTLI